jgi:hypothetical protein
MATTTAHMEVLLKHLQANGDIGEHATMLDSMDGCSKQYQCAKAYWLLSYIAFKFQIIIDLAISAPGHGKGRIDDINATDKQYLATCVCASSMAHLKQMMGKNGIWQQNQFLMELLLQ